MAQHNSEKRTSFIEEDLLHDLITTTKEDPVRLREIAAKSLEKQPLNIEETAVLLAATGKNRDIIQEAAKELKKRVYGKRIVLFAPFYIGSKCVNNCLYCGFRRDNHDAVRQSLTLQQVGEETKRLVDAGHKRLILVFGEHPHYSPEFIAECVKTVYSIKSNHGEIRRVNINAAPLDVNGYRVIRESGIGTYQIFQETYHKPTYEKVHPKGDQKANFEHRLHGLSRAFEGGCDDVGLGVLYGLYDWKYETLAMVQHAVYLQKTYGVGPHTISFPRLKQTSGAGYVSKWIVSNEDFLHLIATLRLAVPYTGLICTARETSEIRKKALEFGVSQIDAGSRIEVGGYALAGDAQVLEKEQFALGDLRTLDETMCDLLQNGYVPSFCTACYKSGRTGEHFMELAIPGFIKRLCTPNALLTLAEYLEDYASDDVKKVGWELIGKELNEMDDKGNDTQKRLNDIRNNQIRGFYY